MAESRYATSRKGVAMAYFRPARRRQRAFGPSQPNLASAATPISPPSPASDASESGEDISATLEQLDATMREATATLETLATRLVQELDELGRHINESSWESYYEDGAPYGNTEAGLKRWLRERAADNSEPAPQQ